MLRTVAAFLLCLTAASVGIALSAPPAPAAVVDPLHLVYNDQVNGAAQMVGNGVMACPSAAGTPRTECLAASQRQNAFNNNRFSMEYADIDGDPATYNSSSGTVTIPAGARIAYARLQWGGNRDGQQCGVGAPGTYPAGSSQTQTVRLTVGGVAPIDVAPQSYAADPGSIGYYTADADVTSAFAELPSGSPVTVTVGNVFAPTGFGCHGGWSLILVHTTDSVPCGTERREIFVYDGHVRQGSADPPTTVTASGFRVSGGAARVGVTAYEGDNGQNGDQFLINGTPMADPDTGSTTNFFASTADNQLDPAYPNNFSLDSKRLDIPAGVINSGSTSATLTTSTTNDAFVLQSMVLTVPVPALCMTKSVSPAVGHVGDTLSWSFTVSNPTTVDALDVVIDDPAVPSCNTTVGILAAGDSQTVTCASIADGDLTNIATATGAGAGGGTLSASAAATVDVLHPAIGITKTADPAVVRGGDPVTWSVTVENTGDARLDPVSVDDDPVDGCDRLGLGSLAPGASTSYTCTTTAGDHGFTNTATATGTDALGRSVTADDAAAFAVIHPAIAVTKTAAPSTAHPGDPITWTLSVTNTGDADLANATVTDDGVAACDRTFATLAAGDSHTWTCQTPAPAGDLTNTLTARASPAMGPDVTDAAAASVDVLDPAIDVEKTGSPDRFLPGDTITWTITVANAGDAPLDPVTVDDDIVDACDRTGLGPLPVGGETTYTCTSVAEADTVTNTVAATGTDGLGEVVTDQDVTTIPVDHPEITLTKQGAPGQVREGDTITWTLGVTNTGDTDLTQLAVTDPLVPGCDRTFATLAVRAIQTWTCTSAAPGGDVVNHVTATAVPPTGPNVSDDATAAVDVIHPGIELTKSADPSTALTGETVTWTMNATNSGDVDLTNVAVSDESVAACDRTFALLAAGDTETWTCASNLGTDDLTNTAVAEGTPDVGPAVADDATASVDVIHPALTISKSADSSLAAEGDTVTWTLGVENTGDVDLSGVTAVDDLATACNRSFATLAVGATETWTCTSSAGSGDLTNTATATGTAPRGPEVSDTATATVEVIHPALSITKSADPRAAVEGDTVTWTIELENIGDSNLAGVTVADDLASACNRVFADLGSGATETWTCISTAGEDDLTNTATATGTSPAGTEVSDIATATLDVVHPAIEVTKTADRVQVTAGDQVTFTITVHNTGDTVVNHVRIQDEAVPDCSRTGVTIPVGESVSVSCTIALVESQTNVAIVTAQPIVGDPVQAEDSVTVDVSPSHHVPPSSGEQPNAGELPDTGSRAGLLPLGLAGLLLLAGGLVLVRRSRR